MVVVLVDCSGGFSRTDNMINTQQRISRFVSSNRDDGLSVVRQVRLTNSIVRRIRLFVFPAFTSFVIDFLFETRFAANVFGIDGSTCRGARLCSGRSFLHRMARNNIFGHVHDIEDALQEKGTME
jgi:hypothetical protein